MIFFIVKFLVRLEGLEPSRREALPPQDSVSTNSTTIAKLTCSLEQRLYSTPKILKKQEKLLFCGCRGGRRRYQACVQGATIGRLLARKYSEGHASHKKNGSQYRGEAGQKVC